MDPCFRGQRPCMALPRGSSSSSKGFHQAMETPRGRIPPCLPFASVLLEDVKRRRKKRCQKLALPPPPQETPGFNLLSQVFFATSEMWIHASLNEEVPPPNSNLGIASSNFSIASTASSKFSVAKYHLHQNLEKTSLPWRQSGQLKPHGHGQGDGGSST